MEVNGSITNRTVRGDFNSDKTSILGRYFNPLGCSEFFVVYSNFIDHKPKSEYSIKESKEKPSQKKFY